MNKEGKKTVSTWIPIKYASISIEKGSIIASKEGGTSERCINIGDQAQLIAIDNLYAYMGIRTEDIVYIEYYDLQNYDGDYVILPINFILFNSVYGERKINFSEKIIPVFLGIHCVGFNFSGEEKEWLKKYQPIGCRDVITMNNLRRVGIEAYTQGCLTITLPKRMKEKAKEGYVYFVDIPETLTDYIPKEISQKGKYLTHVFYGNIGSEQFYGKKTMKEYMKERLQEYAENAELMVTSRLHCAAPCIAMGIPTILVGRSFSTTFSWIENLITMYTEKDFDKIDWNPTPIECEELKRHILNLATYKIRETYKKYNASLQLSGFWEKNIAEYKYNTSYENKVIEFMKQFKDKDSVEYVIWGVTQIADAVCDCLEKEYKNAKLLAVVDEYRELTFRGLKTIKSTELDNYKKVVLIATGNSSSIAMRKYCEERNYPQNQYLLMFDNSYSDYKE